MTTTSTISGAGLLGGLLLLAAPGLAAAQDAPGPLPPVVEAWASAWNAADGAAMAALVAPDAVYEDLAFQVSFTGPEGVEAWVQTTAASIPDAHVEVLDAFQAGDRVAVRWTFSGTPLQLGSIPGTGEGFSVPVVTLIAMEGDLIARVTDAYNLADLQRQMGLPSGAWVPTPAP